MNLLFWKPADGTADLVFGDTGVPVDQHVDATLNDQFDDLFFEARQIPDARLEATFDLGEMTFEGEVEYQSRTQRPTVAHAVSDWQVADFADGVAEDNFSHTQRSSPPVRAAWSRTVRNSSDTTARHGDSARIPSGYATRYENAARLRADDRRSGYQDAERSSRQSSRSRFQQAVPHIGVSRRARHQDADRRPRSDVRTRHQEASARRSLRDSIFRVALPADLTREARYENAIRPPAGIYTPPVNPPVPGGYVPTGHLLFAKLWDGSADLIFNDDGTAVTPEGTVVVPVRSIYMILNNVALRRVSDNAYILPISMSLKLDVDSWTWGFSASLPASAQGLVEPTDYATPVELEVTINTHAYRVLVESISRERTFGTTTLSVSGRGKSAFLDSPYAPTQNFSNSIDRTAQQLMEDALTFNGVSIGWSVAFDLDDWLVPAGVWSHQGSYISALKRIAEAAGGYIQPHPTAQQILVKPRYSTPPWEWDAINTPNFELPSAVTTREAIEWLDAADYNGVYVSGEAQGILAHVKRTGTSGDILAPMVVDPLCTNVTMARQRGIAVLGYTGRIANVTLKLPVLAATGVIRPGAVVRYVDGGVSRVGMVRSTQVDVSFPEVWQSIGVETHA